jgi:hypothetical protein
VGLLLELNKHLVDASRRVAGQDCDIDKRGTAGRSVCVDL